MMLFRILSRNLPSNLICRSFTSFRLQKYPEETIRRLRRKIDAVMQEAEKEEFGKTRGLKTIEAWMKNNPEKVKKMKFVDAKQVLKRFIYRRHALRHGGKHLSDFLPHQLAKTFFEEHTEVEIMEHQAEMILLELWRHNESMTFDGFQRKQDRLLGRLGPVFRDEVAF